VRLLSGQVLGEKYEVLRELHRGGMGRIYLGRSLESDEEVVLKVPLSEEEVSPEVHRSLVERLQVEGEILSGLNHPGVVRLMDSLEGPVLVLEYIRGRSLDEIYRGKGCPWEDAKEVVNQLLDAVAYLHENMVVHRDIKPKNVLVEEESGRVVLIDFGAAKKGFTSVNPMGGTIIGTPGYSAPEQLDWGVAIPQSDIYSLASTIYFLITGKDPSGKIDVKKLIRMGVPENAVNSLIRATNLDPGFRHSSIDEFKSELFYSSQETIIGGAYLVIGEEAFEIGWKEVISIGRGDKVDVKIEDPMAYISKVHCLIVRRGEDYFILDNLSKNGTYVLDRKTGKYIRIRDHKLEDGDIIGLCYNEERGPYLTMTFKRGGV